MRFTGLKMRNFMFGLNIVFCFFLIIISSVPASGEEGQLLLREGDDYYKENRLDLARDKYEKALEVYMKENNREGEGLAYIKVGDVYSSLGLYEKSLDFYEKAINLSKEIKDGKLEGKALLKSGEINLLLGSYEKSLRAYIASLKIYEEAGRQRRHGPFP